MTRIGYLHVSVVLLALTLSSCATMKGWFGKDDPAVDTEAYEVAAPVADPLQDAESDLRQLVRKLVESEKRQKQDNQQRVIRRRPYYYKEYAEYPSSVESAEIDIQEIDSRTRPYIADVKLDKVRYSTRLRRERGEASRDTNFRRDTGTETLTFEYRNGRWTRVGSIFVAESSEDLVDGVWSPRIETQAERVEEEDQRGWFGRTWSRITGGD
jgi:predicted small secreted protein